MKKLLFIALLFTSCTSTVELTKTGESVAIVAPYTREVLSQKTSLGIVDCRGFGMHTFKLEQNVTYCRNAIRNQAAKLGATEVVIESQQLGDMWCDYCVKMVGEAYK